MTKKKVIFLGSFLITILVILIGVKLTSSFSHANNNGNLLYDVIKEEAESGGLATKYIGEHNDTLNGSGNEDIYYFTTPIEDDVDQGNQLKDKWNVVFAGKCWQMIRTTDTGGVKLLYNGEYDETNKCNNTGIATQIGASPYNDNSESMSNVGYMYNKKYEGFFTISKYRTGRDVIYENGRYTVLNPNNSFDGRYTCGVFNESCQSVYFIMDGFIYPEGDYEAPGDDINLYVIKLNNGETIDDAINNMLYTSNVNTNNSTIKEAIDNWYNNNMNNYTQSLEDVIYCNNRMVKDYDEWKINDGFSYSWEDGEFEYSTLEFDNDIDNQSYYCQLITDQFSVSNSQAKLTYPVALPTATEMNMINNNTAITTGENYWLLSAAEVTNYVNNSSAYTTFPKGVRPMISLKPGTTYINGTGTMNDPYVVDTGLRYNISTEVVNGYIDNEVNILPGEDATITYEPKYGYKLKSITVDGEPIDINEYPDSYTFTNVDKDHVIRVEYEEVLYNLKVTTDNNMDSNESFDYKVKMYGSLFGNVDHIPIEIDYSNDYEEFGYNLNYYSFFIRFAVTSSLRDVLINGTELPDLQFDGVDYTPALSEIEQMPEDEREFYYNSISNYQFIDQLVQDANENNPITITINEKENQVILKQDESSDNNIVLWVVPNELDLSSQVGEPDENGYYSFEAKKNQPFTITDLSRGTSYEIIQQPKEGWNLKSKTNDTGTINGDVIATFNNSKLESTLIINKTDNRGNPLEGAEFTLYKENSNNGVNIVKNTNVETDEEFTYKIKAWKDIQESGYKEIYAFSSGDMDYDPSYFHFDFKTSGSVDNIYFEENQHIQDDVEYLKIIPNVFYKYGRYYGDHGYTTGFYVEDKDFRPEQYESLYATGFTFVDELTNKSFPVYFVYLNEQNVFSLKFIIKDIGNSLESLPYIGEDSYYSYDEFCDINLIKYEPSSTEYYNLSSELGEPDQDGYYTFTLSDDESKTIEIPEGHQYEIIEQPKDGWTLDNINGDTSLNKVEGSEKNATYVFNNKKNNTEQGFMPIANEKTVVGTGLEFNLTPGTYELKETKAPSGYKLDLNTYTVNVAEDGTITIEGKEVTQDEDNDNLYHVDMVNDLVPSLPISGGIGITLYRIIGLIVFIFGISGIVLYNKKKKES